MPEFHIYCRRTGEVVATVQYRENSGSCDCLDRDHCVRKYGEEVRYPMHLNYWGSK